jgi:predicted AAA+ superfamily ATPase
LLSAYPAFLDNAFKQKFMLLQHNNIYDRKTMLSIAFRGGYPEAIKLEENERQQWHKDYITALLEHDLSDIAHITRFDAMRKLISILAAWSSKFMDISAISAGLSIRRPTVESYINALEQKARAIPLVHGRVKRAKT